MLAYKRIRLFKLEKKYFMQSQACIHVYAAREDEAWRFLRTWEFHRRTDCIGKYQQLSVYNDDEDDNCKCNYYPLTNFFSAFFSDCFYQVINARNQQENKCICEIQNNVHILPTSRHELIIENMKDIINQNMHLYCSHCQAPELEFPECKEK